MGNSRIISLITIVLILVTGLGLWLSGGIETLGLRLFGPPEVEMAETYGVTGGVETYDHSTYNQLVSTQVDSEGLVDYVGIGRHAAELDAYLTNLATANLDILGRDERLALLINAYNAFTLQLILDHLPVESIRDIPSRERWDGERWVLAGRTYSLNQIEHELIRPNFREPRIHFALVCAAIGCPPLRSEAYVGTQIERQLEDQALFVHGSERWLRYERGNKTVEITALYQWYAGDFEQIAGSVLEYLARYDDNLAADLLVGHRPKIRHLDYDWSLNTKP